MKRNNISKISKKTSILNIFIVLLLFAFAFGIRLLTLNQIGRTWDEPQYIEQGYRLINLFRKGDFDNSYFYTTYDHPPLVKYIYGISSLFDIEKVSADGQPQFRYDYTASRTLSALIFSFSVVLLTIIGWHLVSRFVGIVSGTVLALLPFSLGLSQLVTTESFIMLIFTASVYSYILLLKKYCFKKLIITGILTGIALQVKQSNILLFPLYLFMYFVWHKKSQTKKQMPLFNERIKAIFAILLISIIVFILLWPHILIHFNDVYALHRKFWNVQFSPKIWQITLSPPEVFFGRLMLTPVFYYPVYFFITTPILILVAFLIGLKTIYQSKKWILYIVVLWFIIPFAMSLYSWRQHGVRYIIQMYAPLSLIAAIGFETFISKFSRHDNKKIIFFIPVVFYLCFILLKIQPYYLDYFNILVGGTAGVYKHKSFQLGWWGQGVRDAGTYVLEHAPAGSSVGLAVSPIHSVPPMPSLEAEQYVNGKQYDYIIVNYYRILREGFDDNEIRKKYKTIYEVKADGAVLATVYKKK